MFFVIVDGCNTYTHTRHFLAQTDVKISAPKCFHDIIDIVDYPGVG